MENSMEIPKGLYTAGEFIACTLLTPIVSLPVGIYHIVNSHINMKNHNREITTLAKTDKTGSDQIREIGYRVIDLEKQKLNDWTELKKGISLVFWFPGMFVYTIGAIFNWCLGKAKEPDDIALIDEALAQVQKTINDKKLKENKLLEIDNLKLREQQLIEVKESFSVVPPSLEQIKDWIEGDLEQIFNSRMKSSYDYLGKKSEDWEDFHTQILAVIVKYIDQEMISDDELIKHGIISKVNISADSGLVTDILFMHKLVHLNHSMDSENAKDVAKELKWQFYDALKQDKRTLPSHAKDVMKWMDDLLSPSKIRKKNVLH